MISCHGSSFSFDQTDITSNMKCWEMTVANGDVEGVGLALDGLGARGSGRPGGPRSTGRSVKVG